MPALIDELYDEAKMMKMTVDPIKKQKDKTRSSENSRLLMENCGSTTTPVRFSPLA